MNSTDTSAGAPEQSAEQGGADNRPPSLSYQIEAIAAFLKDAGEGVKASRTTALRSRVSTRKPRNSPPRKSPRSPTQRSARSSTPFTGVSTDGADGRSSHTASHLPGTIAARTAAASARILADNSRRPVCRRRA